MEHFQTEINLKKKIVEKETIIENLKNELSEKESEFMHANKANYRLLQNQIEEKKDDIKDKIKKINKGYIKQNELVKKRKQIQAKISKVTNTDGNNPQVKNLYNIYKYYLNLLENMNTEHRKFVTINDIKRKERKINILTEQLDLRDMYIKDAYKEIELNKCDFNYKNPKIISSEELDLAPIRPPIIKLSPSFNSLQELSKNLALNKSNTNANDKEDNESSKEKNKKKSKFGKLSEGIRSSKNDRKYAYSVKSEKYKQMLNEQQNLNKLSEIKKNLETNTTISKKRQFGNEILALFKYNPKISNSLNPNNNGFDKSLFERKKYNSPNNIFLQSRTLQKAGERAIQDGNNINKKTYQNYINNQETKKNYNFRYDGNGNFLRNKKTRNFNNFGNISFSRDDSMSKSHSKIEITNTSPLENEVQKKVKTILKKDYIGRYKRSPYLKLFEQ